MTADTAPSQRIDNAPPLGARSRRPFGVYVVALLQGWNALAHGFGVVIGAEDRVIGGMGRFEGDAVALAVMLAGLGVAVGLVLLKRWAWVATMIWAGALMAVEMSVYFSGRDANYLVMALSVAQVFYLNLSEVQAAFGRRATESVGDVRKATAIHD
ncbi:MAG TPA: hypothetical protein VH951_05850 [Dehalococcoidia bacterium]|jgi:hypothetical protein